MLRRRMIFSHNDLDGIACIIIGKKIMSSDIIDAKSCSYGNINNTIKKFISSKEYDNYHEIFITDISVSEEVANLIDSIPELKAKVVLLDHHASAKWLNKYEWASVIPEKNEQPTCGASLLFDYLTTKDFDEDSKEMYDLSYYVWLWDTWLWKTKFNHLNVSEKAVRLNSLFHLLGEEDFINAIVKDKNYNDVEGLLLKHKLLLDINERQKNEYINKKEYQLRSINISGYNAGVVFADNHLSELGNALAERHPEYDFIAMISGPTISFRSREESDIDLGALVKELYGGGGHPHAAGCTVTKEIIEEAMCLFLG